MTLIVSRIAKVRWGQYTSTNRQRSELQVAVNLVLPFPPPPALFYSGLVGTVRRAGLAGQHGGARPPSTSLGRSVPPVTRVEQTYTTQHTVFTIMLPDSAHYVTMSHCLCYNTMSIAH